MRSRPTEPMTPTGISARERCLRVLACLTAAAGCLAPVPAHALLPNSPRVQRLLKAGLDTLESLPPSIPEESELGGKCVVALALHKGGRKKSPRIAEAIKACREELDPAAGLKGDNHVYSHGLAIITLAEIAPQRERNLLQQYLSTLGKKQKANGGWGYNNSTAGDTSQTQYVALGLWQAHRAGIRVDPKAARGMIQWLMATQDPSGAWGYQGRMSTTSGLTGQDKVSPTMAAAAGASLMIGADLHGLLSEGMLDTLSDLSSGDRALPTAVRPVMEGAAENVRPLPPEGINWPRVNTALRAGEKWMESDAVNPPNMWACYYLYAIERYHSFREARAGEIDLEPSWYEKGVGYLESNQKEPGVWDAGCGKLVDTGFATLFLLRSTQKALSGGIGEGAMVGGRGLPKNLAGARLRRGQVVVDMDEVGVGDFLAMIDKGESDRLDALASDPLALIVGDLSEADTERLEQSLRTGSPDQRLLATHALAKTDSLDRVPALLYAMTDPDRRVTLAARDALRRLARRPKGYDMPDEYNDNQRYFAIEQWKRWYLTLRPEAPIDLGR